MIISIVVIIICLRFRRNKSYGAANATGKNKRRRPTTLQRGVVVVEKKSSDKRRMKKSTILQKDSTTASTIVSGIKSIRSTVSSPSPQSPQPPIGKSPSPANLISPQKSSSSTSIGSLVDGGRSNSVVKDLSLSFLFNPERIPAEKFQFKATQMVLKQQQQQQQQTKQFDQQQKTAAKTMATTKINQDKNILNKNENKIQSPSSTTNKQNQPK
ncbi:hypothetical protein HUG17_9383 [Dermatophagoides farinae]|uniref:Uncharacterized protein n=1 Tax=Dermatophagoides farinae TaxID=6954 RepID=A0A9D4NUN8_DERFA|nr:hypothetical protein HUG17_9383 [Dermatophagoides farinae]